MSKNQNVSLSVIRRMPRYYRYLGELLNKGVYRISSRELANMMNLTASQIRQDLNCFGGFGQQGYGYNVKALQGEIAIILGLDKRQQAILVGVGNLGKTIASHLNFENLGFELIGAFDPAVEKQPIQVRGIQVSHPDQLEEFCKTNKPSVAILCIPKETAIKVAEELIGYGIKGFWNFSHYDIDLNHDNIIVENVHLADSMMTLSYRINSFLASEN